MRSTNHRARRGRARASRSPDGFPRPGRGLEADTCSNCGKVETEKNIFRTHPGGEPPQMSTNPALFLLQTTSKTQISGIDWVVIAIYFGILLSVAWWVVKKGKDSAADYFLAGR